MKKIFTLFLAAMSLLMTSSLNAQNLLAGWDGNGVTGDLSKPSDAGWLNESATTANLWTIANGSGGCRFRDSGVTGGYTANSIYLEGAPTNYLTSRFLMVRWDNSAYSTSYYAYPMTLEANTKYTFSMDYFYGGSGSAGLTLTGAVSTTVDNAGQIASKVFATTTVNVMRSGSFSFTTGETAGTYYFTFNGAWAWFGVANLTVIKNTELLDDLNLQYTNLTLGDLSGVTSNITLPTTVGDKGVTVRWASSKPAIIDTLGHVVRPEMYNKSVVLTATLTQTVNGKIYNLTKSFTAKVLGIVETPEEVATFNFNSENITMESDTLRVTDAVSGFKGKVINEARIRTIGNTEKINVLDLGNGKGYFDMGKEIGKVIYSLDNFSMMGYFRVNENYTNIAAGGNYYWNFSNSADVGKYANGFMYGRLNAQAVGISAAAAPSTATSVGSAAAIGAWHHITYTQKGDTGTVYIDGVQSAQKIGMPTPATALAKDSMQGTICNWLGRSGWAADAYLQQTLLYDFRVLSLPVSGDDINLGYEGFEPIAATLDKLNNAYLENPDYISAELNTEFENLNLGDLTHVTANLTLPTAGATDNTVTIKWKTGNNKLIDATGVVTRPDFYDYTTTLTATLLKGGQSVTKTFTATVAANDGSAFANDLLVKHDFANASVNDSIVYDAAEKHFAAKLKNDAKINVMGTSTKYKVLNLGDSIGYLDLGPEIGKLMYNQNDYTMSAYYRVEDDTTTLVGNGHFIWTFSNGDDQMTNQNGYIIGSLINQSVSITPGYYTAATGNQAVGFTNPAFKGSWHHLAYTQSGETGTIYIDGLVQATGTITNLPSTALPKANMLGTPFNWIGRSNYTTDKYLRKTLVYDFRLYRKALTGAEIETTDLNVVTTIGALDAAYAEGISAVKPISASNFKVTSTIGKIKVSGLTAGDKVTVFDIAGRKINATTQSDIAVNAGVYIVKINNYVTKVIVK